MNDQLTVHVSDATVHINKDIIEIWEEYRQISSEAKEACGILIGHQIQGTEIFQIEFVTTPQKLDIRTRYNFVMKDPFHQRFLDTKYKESNGTSVYLGTWHSHPESIPTPSSIDKQDWENCIARNHNRRLFFVIVGIKEVKIYTDQNSYLSTSSALRF
ncbi:MULTISPECIES: Mov34/MPN/PAD-1 family protein [Acinetobacter]|uniref:Integrative and conjugative element protein, VC0181 family n=1 Tax=Acinetobacter marinus TaxID=281375 RepID=A0A1G6PLT7_9GAMM|nr:MULTISPECIES: Mov34/MPN/PAD-1 family protein [Acinetobacter]MBL8282026.1 Mov34/MPN/PAD-1 family protein [Acinetobacter junii]SDC81170.1 integrative and conjugative element protein, VC0181 family [Acinetobacter marinus]